jgi:hypothetical protein
MMTSPADLVRFSRDGYFDRGPEDDAGLNPGTLGPADHADILALERLFEQRAQSMQTPSLAQSVSKSRALQPGQPLPGVLDFRQAGGISQNASWLSG